MLWLPASPISSAKRFLIPLSSATCRTFSSMAARVAFSPHALSLSDAGSVILRPRQEEVGAETDRASAAYPEVMSARAAHNNIMRPTLDIPMVPEPGDGVF